MGRLANVREREQLPCCNRSSWSGYPHLESLRALAFPNPTGVILGASYDCVTSVVECAAEYLISVAF